MTSLVVGAICANTLHAEKLPSLNLPKTGKTTQSLATQEELTKRLVELVWCEGSMIVGGQTLYGSGDCLDMRGENIKATLAGKPRHVAIFFLDAADLGLCATYVYGKLTDGTGFFESMAFAYGGLTASYDAANKAMELSGVKVTWPENGGDLTQISGAPAMFVKDATTLVLPYDGPKGAQNAAAFNELSQVCADLGW